MSTGSNSPVDNPKTHEELLEYLSELPDYIKSEKPQVREKALEVLKGCSTAEDYQIYLRKLDFLGWTLRLLKDDSVVIQQLTQTCLVNLSTDEIHRMRLLDEGIIDIVMELLVQSAKRGKSPRLLLMLLTNLTVGAEGVSQMMQEGKSYQGLHIIRLLTWYCDEELYKRDRSTGLDNWAKCAGVLANLSQSEIFRKLFIDETRGFIKHVQWNLKLLLFSPSDQYTIERFTGLLRVFHNLAQDVDKQYAILNPENEIFVAILLPILRYNDGVLDNDDLQQMPTDLTQLIQLSILQCHPSKTLRQLTYQLLLILVRNAPARKYVRASNIYFIVREAHKYEREVECDELDNFIDDELIHYFLLDEDEGADGEWSAEKERALDMLKRQQDGLDLVDKVEKEDIDGKLLNEQDSRALLEPTEDGGIMDAQKYNDERKRLHDEEEKRQEEAIRARMANIKQSSYDKPNVLDFL